MTHKEALTLALEALWWANEEINGWMDDAQGLDPVDHPEIMSAITAIKEALAQPDRISDLKQKTKDHSVDCLCADCLTLDEMEEALAQPEQEPVARVLSHKEMAEAAKRYTTPPYVPTERQRTWVGLTDEERCACMQSPFITENYRAIEAKLKEKNT